MPLVGLTGRAGALGVCRLPWSKRSSSSMLLRSLDEREWGKGLLSRSASVLVGDLSALGNASSSIVFPRDLVGARDKVRLRMVMPWRCLSLRFYKSQLQHHNMSCNTHIRQQPGPLARWRGQLRLGRLGHGG